MFSNTALFLANFTLYLKPIMAFLGAIYSLFPYCSRIQD